MDNDAELLRRYADSRSETAFAELVRRHVGFVYHAALRQTGGDAHRAQDVAQQVFADLARKARALAQRPVLAGWLHTSTRYAVLQVLRTERRRQEREQQAAIMSDADRPDLGGNEVERERLTPFLDDALQALGEQDREAVLLRFFQGQSFAEVGARLSLSEDAARVRVNRALERIRTRFARHGVTSIATLTSLLSAQAGAAVPVGLAAAVTNGALAAGGAPAVFYTLMNLTKMKIALGLGVMATGVTALVVEHQENTVLHAEVARLQEMHPATAALAAENTRLKANLAQLESQRHEDAELIELMGEESGLKARVIENAQKHARSDAAIVARLAARLAELSPYDMKELDRAPILSVPLMPIFPLELKNAGVEGEVLMEFVIDRMGAVTDVKAVRSTHLEFEVAAEEALKQWKFTPGQKGGLAVNTRVSQLLKFELPKKR